MKAGDKVVCVNDRWSIRLEMPHPKKGDIDDVEGIEDDGELPGYYLKGYNWKAPDSTRISFAVNQFRPVDETFGEEVADRIETLVTIEEAEKEFA